MKYRKLPGDELINSKIHPKDEMMGVMKKKGVGQAAYLESGRKNTEVFYEIVKRHSPSLVTEKRILDYGCGYGRMTRHFKNFFSLSTVVSAEVTDDMINFCAKEFGSIPFLISDDNPISNFGSKFDVIIAVSVFSHLPPKSFEHNMVELGKSLDEKGLLMFTTAGEQVAKKIHKTEIKNGYIFSSRAQNTNETERRIPVEKYASMLVTPAFVENILNLAGLRILEFIPNGHVGRQDLFVVTHK